MKNNPTYITSEYADDKSQLQIPKYVVEKVILVEFAQVFPDWGFATIFGFLISVKSQSNFKEEKEIRMKRKLRNEKQTMS